MNCKFSPDRKRKLSNITYRLYSILGDTFLSNYKSRGRKIIVWSLRRMFRGINIPDRLNCCVKWPWNRSHAGGYIWLWPPFRTWHKIVALLSTPVSGQKIVCRIIIFTKSVIYFEHEYIYSILNLRIWNHAYYVTIRLQPSSAGKLNNRMVEISVFFVL